MGGWPLELCLISIKRFLENDIGDLVQRGNLLGRKWFYGNMRRKREDGA